MNYPPVLSGNQVILRAPTIDDIDNICAQCKDKAILNGTGIPFNPYRLEHARDFVKSTRKDHKKGIAQHWAIVDCEANRLAGMISIVFSKRENRSAEIGYWLGRSHWSKGMMKEALQLCLKAAFKAYKLNRVFAHVFPSNERSIKLLTRSGFSLEGTLRRTRKCRGRWKDELLFSILSEEWRGGGTTQIRSFGN
jgi:RimJ/RimL family protein N-acetyltransferase